MVKRGLRMGRHSVPGLAVVPFPPSLEHAHLHMTPTTNDTLDAIFSALANPTRRALLRRLRSGPARITDLAEPFDMSFAAVSKHIRVLERAGLVTRRIEGRVHHCAIDAAPLAEAERWLAAQRTFWEGTLDSLATHLEDTEETP